MMGMKVFLNNFFKGTLASGGGE